MTLPRVEFNDQSFSENGRVTSFQLYLGSAGLPISFRRSADGTGPWQITPHADDRAPYNYSHLSMQARLAFGFYGPQFGKRPATFQPPRLPPGVSYADLSEAGLNLGHYVAPPVSGVPRFRLDRSNEPIVEAFHQTHAGFSAANIVVEHYPRGAFVARGEHGGVSIDVTRTAEGLVRVRYLNRNTEGHAYAEHGPNGTSVQIVGGGGETERLDARNAAFALADRIGRAAGRTVPLRQGMSP